MNFSIKATIKCVWSSKFKSLKRYIENREKLVRAEAIDKPE